MGCEALLEQVLLCVTHVTWMEASAGEMGGKQNDSNGSELHGMDMVVGVLFHLA